MRLSRRQLGLTLIETMITMAILCFGVIAIMKLQSFMVQNSTYAKQQAEAVRIAESKIEQFRGYSTINTGGGMPAYDDIINGSQVVPGTNTQYTLNWAVTTNTNPANKAISVTVTWTDSNAVSQTRQFSTIISKMDPTISGSSMEASGVGSIHP
jgi:type IV pilus assembly protein PilV